MKPTLILNHIVGFMPSTFQILEQEILNAISPRFKNFCIKNNILVLHRIYDSLRPINQFVINISQNL
jgi:hypothetical protein